MKGTFIAILIAGALIGGAFMFSGSEPEFQEGGQSVAPANLSLENGVQIIDIRAKGGYSPRKITATAGIPTIIRMNTRGTFDCSSALVIPDLGYRGNLPPNGTTEISVPPQQAGSTLQGACQMGMYSFAIKFE